MVGLKKIVCNEIIWFVARLLDGWLPECWMAGCQTVGWLDGLLI